LPSISGSTVEGERLTATAGTWTGSPTSYAYQWEDCNTSGESCSQISGATASSYKLARGDVGHKVRVAVTASNAGGSTRALSAPTTTITEDAGPKTDCFQNPGEEGKETKKIEECGYPGYKNTGPETGVTLKEESAWNVKPSSGFLDIVKTGVCGAEGVWTIINNSCTTKLSSSTTIEGRRIHGYVQIETGTVGAVLKNDEIITEGTSCSEPVGSKPKCEGDYSFYSLNSDGTKSLVSHVALGGSEHNGANLVHECLYGGDKEAVYAYLRITNCDGVKLNSGGTLEHSYCYDNAEEESVEGPGHYECISLDCGAEVGPLTVNNDTLINPHIQTAVIFQQNTFGTCTAARHIENNFFAGGSKMASGPGPPASAEEFVIGNRFAFAKCANGKTRQLTEEGAGNTVCEEQHWFGGGPTTFAHQDRMTPETPGEAGYWPNGGSYNTGEGIVGTWEKNYRDDTLEAVPCAGTCG